MKRLLLLSILAVIAIAPTASGWTRGSSYFDGIVQGFGEKTEVLSAPDEQYRKATYKTITVSGDEYRIADNVRVEVLEHQGNSGYRKAARLTDIRIGDNISVGKIGTEIFEIVVWGRR